MIPFGDAADEFKPWQSIWTRPGPTIQRIVDTDPHRHLLLLAAIGGMSGVVDQAVSRNLGERYSLVEILGWSVAFGALLGIAGNFIWAWLIQFTGRPLGGRASLLNLRVASAWPSVPMAVSLAALLLIIAATGKVMFMAEPGPGVGMREGVMLLSLAVVQFMCSVWAIYIFVKCLAQVQSFTLGRAIGNTLLAFGALFVPAIVIAVDIGKFMT